VTEQPKPSGEGNSPDNQPSAKLTPGPILPSAPENREPSASQANTSRNNAGDSETKRELHWLEKLNFAGQLCLVLVGGIAASIYGCQLKVMQGQLSQMEGSSQQTDKLLGLYQQQLGKLDESISQASRLATATEKANSNVLTADRPWFGATLTQQDAIEVGKIPSATIIFVNSGKRPARVVLAESADNWYDKFPQKPSYQTMPLISTEMVVPGSAVTDKFNLSKQPLSQLEVDTAQTGKPARLFLYANVEYVDVKTSERYFTHACWVYIGNEPTLSKGFYNCGEYQDAK
jgi:hypothetical protein